MKTSIATVSLSGTLETKLRAVAAAGFEGVEIFESDLLAYPGPASEVRSIIADLGLTCTLFQPFRDFEGLPEPLRTRVFDRVERKFDLMQELGTDLLLVCSSLHTEAVGDHDRIAEDFRELGERAGRRGLRVGYEALAWGRHVNDHRQVWDIVRKVDHPAVGIILDSFHSLVRKIPVESLADIDPDKIFIVQLADAPWLQMDYLSWSRHFRNMPGQGDIPVRAFVSELLRIGYTGPLSLEIFNDRFRSMPASVVAQDGMRSLKLSIDEGARAIDRHDLQSMPPRVHCKGVNYVEFALTEKEAAELSSILRSLGFVLTGRHRTKAVSRWRQGSIDFVLNCDPDGFAASHNNVHGPSVCAICLEVDDVAAALERGSALAISTFTGRGGRGDEAMPALRDPSGALIYLVDEGQAAAHWEDNFDPVEFDTGGAGLVSVDHVTYALPSLEMLSWVEYYFALFEVEKPAAFEFVDPLGLIESQPIQTPEGRLQFLFNGSSAPDTLASRLHQRYWGVGVQYVSLGTNDIFATARQLETLGLERLAISQNYYDDIEARFGLSPALIDEMARFGILYDRDEEGEYFQLNSRAFHKRFYFEIVERRGAYNSYGAANEPIRLAAQSRFRVESELTESADGG